MSITEIDRSVIRSVIERQLEAFHRDDFTSAFALASPAIQIQFSTPHHFMSMVKAAYSPLCNPRSVLFEKFLVVDGYPAQSVLFMDERGQLCRGIYLMQKQFSSEWRIHGCCLLALDDSSWQ